MKDRFRKPKKKKKQKLNDIKTFFLACELKPSGPNSLWSACLENFAYDVKPAFIYGSLGVVGYTPDSYAVVDINEAGQPLLGYICTITEATTLLMLDKLKGYNGPDAFNMHNKKLVHAYTDIEVVTNAWCYSLSEFVLESYEQIEQVEFGIWDQDEKQLNLLEKIGESL